jgi:hypothetical protein
MPLHWTIDSRAKLLVVTAEGAIQLEEAERLLDVVIGSNILGYRKLFDGREADRTMSSPDLLTVGVRLRELHATAGPALGPLALVVRDENFRYAARLLGILAVAKRPFRVFKELNKAQTWLDSPSIRAKMPV